MEKITYIAPVLRVIEVKVETTIALSDDFEKLTTTQSSDGWED